MKGTRTQFEYLPTRRAKAGRREKTMIKVWYHNGETFLYPNFATSKELSQLFSEAGHAALTAMKEAGAAHAIYGTRSYDRETGKLLEADVYAPAVLLDDAEFYRRVEAHLAEHPGDLILAHHNADRL